MITQRGSLTLEEKRRLTTRRIACLMGGIMQLVDEQGKMENSEVNCVGLWLPWYSGLPDSYRRGGR